jgi:ATP-binding cassette subfamily F protein 3
MMMIPMKLLRCESISKTYADSPIIEGVSFDILDGRRYGLIGANGSGKTTLLSIIIGDLDADVGRIIADPSVRIGFVPQFPRFDPEYPVFRVLAESIAPLERELRSAEAALSETGEDGIGMERALARYQAARDSWDAAGGDELGERIDRLLEQAGLADRRDTLAGKLSSGEQNILALLKALLDRPNLLILDEPGNHLDYLGLAWLEAFLKDFRGAVLVVSHNRYLLDRVATDILQLESGTVTRYAGNYSDYRLARLKEASARQAAYAANQRTIRRIEEMVARFAVIAASRPDPAWGKRLRAARSRLAQEQDRAVERPELAGPAIRPEFGDGKTKGDAALRIREHSMSRGGNLLLDSASLEVGRGMRVGLVGPNGCGKTSLLEELVEQASWDHPTLGIVESLNVGYVRQSPSFSGDHASLEDYVRSWGALSREQAYALLRPMNFRFGDMAKDPSALSGGEINRVQIARMMYEKPDILILDEPTNHLDIPSREALEEALEDFNGTLLAVSHDRYFLDRVIDHVAEIAGGKITMYPGSFSEYFHHRGGLGRSSGKVSRRGREQGRVAAGGKVPRAGGASAADREASVLEDRIADTESGMEKLEADVEAALARGDHKAARLLSGRLDKEKKLLDDLYRRWDIAAQDR